MLFDLYLSSTSAQRCWVALQSILGRPSWIEWPRKTPPSWGRRGSLRGAARQCAASGSKLGNGADEWMNECQQVYNQAKEERWRFFEDPGTCFKSPLISFFSVSAPSSCFLLSRSLPEDRRLTPAWDSRFFSWLHSRSSSDCTTLGLNLSAYVLETHRQTHMKQSSPYARMWRVYKGALTRCWWRESAADEWMPPWGQCWAETLQVSAAAGVAAPAWSPSHTAVTERWANR